MTSPDIEIQVSQPFSSTIPPQSFSGENGIYRSCCSSGKICSDAASSSTSAAPGYTPANADIRTGSVPRQTVLCGLPLQQQQQQQATTSSSPVVSLLAPNGATESAESDLSAVSFARVFDVVERTLTRNERRQTEQDRREQVRVEWQQVAVVVDRALLVVFVGATMGASAAILFHAPHSIDFLLGIEPTSAAFNSIDNSNGDDKTSSASYTDSVQ